jgi:NAD(P)-dependent dehydrogenase (short-subunit alcohol dehydrogenase family)
MSYWKDKVALITGGSAGLGLALAERLAREGARVAIAARGEEALRQAAAELGKSGAEILPIVADITQDADVERLMAAVVGRFGRLDLLINSAGRSARGEILATTPEDFQQLFELNLLGTVRVTRAAAPHLLAAGGHLVNIGSLAGKSAARYLGAYPASKFALSAYTQQLRLELGPRGLKVLLVCPGPIARDEPRAYVPADSSLPASAKKPGGGVKVSRLAPDRVATAILHAAERGLPELILPGKARLLFVLAEISPRLGDWLLRRMT